VPNDIDAAVQVNQEYGTVYFFKGDKVWTWDVAAGHLSPSTSRSLTTVFPGVPWSSIDAAVNWGNGRLYFFKGRDYVRFNLVNKRVDRSYPRTISSGWNGLFQGPLDAGLSFASQIYGNGRVTSNEERFFSFNLGEEPRTVKVELSGSGDADLYVRRGTRPTTADWNCRPFDSDSSEECMLIDATGRISVMVRGYSASSDFKLRATWAD